MSLEQLTDPAKLLDLLRTSAIATIQETCRQIPVDHVILFTANPDKALSEWVKNECIPEKMIFHFIFYHGSGHNYVFGLHRSGILINRGKTLIVRAEDFSAEQLVMLLERIKQFTTITPLPTETAFKIFFT